MHSTLQAQKAETEGRIILATQAIQNDQKLTVRKASRLYNAPRSTLQNRLAGIQPQAIFNARKRKLLPTEEQTLVKWILDLDRRGFPSHIIDVRRMADVLLAARAQSPPPQPIGKSWVPRFVRSQPELRTKWNRKFHSQRAKSEDPAVINAWFKLVQEMRQTYGILDEDIYNFDETEFTKGIAATSKVITSSDTNGQAAVVQPGNCDWITVIEAINTSGRSIPPFIILAGNLYQASWYRKLPADWVISMSDNGRTTDELGFEWLKHFNKHTESRTTGVYRLLILDVHGSHGTPEFDQYCTQNRIISLCMPANTSHLLQPLDVGCFSPLKTAYRNEVGELARQGVFHIDKEEFLDIYPRVRTLIFSEKNIKSGFRATGLVPYNPERVLTSLTIVRIPSPPTAVDSETAWIAETPHAVAHLQQQAQLVRDLVDCKSQSPTSQAISQTTTSTRKRAPPTCSNCHVQGHYRNQCARR
jgi:hypothetical protein